MKKRIIYTERLRKLALHLLKDETNSEDYEAIFDSEIVEHSEYVEEIHAFFVQPILESSRIFPKDWTMSEDGNIYWKKDITRSAYKSALGYYGITEGMFCHLFVPRHQNPLVYGGKQLGFFCTPAQIGKNILALLEVLRIQAN